MANSLQEAAGSTGHGLRKRSQRSDKPHHSLSAKDMLHMAFSRQCFSLTCLSLWAHLSAAPAVMAQDMMRNLDLASPAFTEAELSREEVVGLLKNAGAEKPLDLSGKSLNGIDLSGLDFEGAIFRSARLNKANLAGADLENAVLDQAWMLSANLADANLRGASLFQTQLGMANLDGVDMTGARVAADLTRASLKSAVLREADFSADMRNQSMGLMRGVLRSANLDGADLTKANLARADLEFASLRGATLEGANLDGAEAGGADFTDADIDGASFARTDLDSARLGNLKGETATSFDGALNLKTAIRK